jgi:Uma2 family endonuclease
MTVVNALPRGALTRDDLDATPDDGHRYELVDGALLVTPAPGYSHQLAVVRLWRLIDDARAADQVALVAPFDVVLSETTVFEPDVLLASRRDFTDRELDGPPILAVEVLSPSTRSIDRLLKHARYAEAGVQHYWIIDPLEPSLTAYLLTNRGAYDEVAHVVGDAAYECTEPIRASIVPAALVT